MMYRNIPVEEDLVNLFRILVHVSISGYLSVNRKVCLAFEDMKFEKSIKEMFGFRRKFWVRLMVRFKTLLHFKVYKDKYSNSLWKGKAHLLKPAVDLEIGDALKWVMFERMSGGAVETVPESAISKKRRSLSYLRSLKRVNEEREKFEKRNSVLRKTYLLKEEILKEIREAQHWLVYSTTRCDISIMKAHIVIEIPKGCQLKHVQTVERHFLSKVDFVRITAPIRKAKKRERMLAEKERLRIRDRDRAFAQLLREEDENDRMAAEDFDIVTEDDDPAVIAEKRRKARDIEGEKLVKYILPLWKKKKLIKRMKFMPAWVHFHREVDRRTTERAILNAEKRKSKKLNKSRARDELGLNYSYSSFSEDWALKFLAAEGFEGKLALLKEYGKFCYANGIDIKLGTAWSSSYMVFRE
jgi:hypothetical protein